MSMGFSSCGNIVCCTGLATDENDHLWVGIATKGAGKLIEVDPETEQIVSTIG